MSAGQSRRIERRREARLDQIGARGIGSDADEPDHGDDGEGQEYGDGAPPVAAKAPCGPCDPVPDPVDARFHLPYLLQSFVQIGQSR